MLIRKSYIDRGLIIQSYNKYNLYNLFSNAYQPSLQNQNNLRKTAFQLQWSAKRQLVPYYASMSKMRVLRKTITRTLPIQQRLYADRRNNMQLTLINAGDQAKNKTRQVILPYPPTTMLTFAFMERQLQTILFRACFVTSVNEARHLIRTGMVSVNGRVVKYPSYICEDGDIAQVLRPEKLQLLNGQFKGLDMEDDAAADAEQNADSDESTSEQEAIGDQEGGEETGSKKYQKYLQSVPKSTQDHGLHAPPMMAPWVFVPNYLEVNYKNLSVCFLRSPMLWPGRCEIPSPYDDTVHQKTYEYFVSNKRPF
ncbi:hypothetical protein MP228_004030 [Amoeboaphelidium protococcarum]|nr:hypothetical protein MP228_004030 [Amoeboaphelidium protococcarum]